MTELVPTPLLDLLEEIVQLKEDNETWQAVANYHYKQAFNLRKNIIIYLQRYEKLSKEEAVQMVKDMTEE